MGLFFNIHVYTFQYSSMNVRQLLMKSKYYSYHYSSQLPLTDIFCSVVSTDEALWCLRGGLRMSKMAQIFQLQFISPQLL